MFLYWCSTHHGWLALAVSLNVPCNIMFYYWVGWWTNPGAGNQSHCYSCGSSHHRLHVKCLPDIGHSGPRALHSHCWLPSNENLGWPRARQQGSSPGGWTGLVPLCMCVLSTCVVLAVCLQGVAACTCTGHSPFASNYMVDYAWAKSDEGCPFKVNCFILYLLDGLSEIPCSVFVSECQFCWWADMVVWSRHTSAQTLITLHGTWYLYGMLVRVQFALACRKAVLS